MLGLAEKKRRSARHGSAVDLAPIAKDPLDRILLSRQPGAGLRVDRRARPRARATRNCRDDPGMARHTAISVFNPCWDDLRGDKRFDKIVAAAKAASR